MAATVPKDVFDASQGQPSSREEAQEWLTAAREIVASGVMRVRISWIAAILSLHPLAPMFLDVTFNPNPGKGGLVIKRSGNWAKIAGKDREMIRIADLAAMPSPDVVYIVPIRVINGFLAVLKFFIGWVVPIEQLDVFGTAQISLGVGAGTASQTNLEFLPEPRRQMNRIVELAKSIQKGMAASLYLKDHPSLHDMAKLQVAFDEEVERVKAARPGDSHPERQNWDEN